MKHLWKLLVLFTCTHIFAFSELKTYRDLVIPNDGKKTLVIFDIDNTLLRPKEEFGSHQWGDYMADRYLKSGHTESEAKTYQVQAFSRAQAFVNPILVDQNIFPLLSQLNDRDIPYLALTARSSNPLREITIKQMREVKLLTSFDRNQPQWENLSYIEDIIQQGIVFANGISKGEVLKRILKSAKNKPERIIFIDDRDYNVISIENAGKELGIETLAYRFSAADNIVANFNSELADSQWYATKYLSDPKEFSALRSIYKLGETLSKWELNDLTNIYQIECYSHLESSNLYRIYCSARQSGDIKVLKYLAKIDTTNNLFIREDWTLF